METEFTALVVKPSASNMHYAAEAIPLPAPTPNWNIYDIHPRYTVGLDFGFKLINRETNNFFTVDWEYFRATAANGIVVDSSNMVGPFFEIGPDASEYFVAAGCTRFIFNQVNVDVGHIIDCGNCLQTSIFGGVGIVDLQQTLSFDYGNAQATISRNIFTPISFVGAGPQLGAAVSYNFNQRFYWATKGLISLFSGSSKNCTQYTSISPALQTINTATPNRQRTCVQKRMQVIPAFQQKIGIGFMVKEERRYAIRLEVGYQAQTYIDALQTVDIGSEVNTPPVTPDTVGVYARTFQRNVSNFSLSGPYATLDIRF